MKLLSPANALALGALVLTAFRAAHASASTQAPGRLGLDDIQFWTGSGTNRAALVIHWSAPEVRDSTTVPNPIANKSLAWGFRWNGTANGDDLLDAIAAADPRLFVLASAPSASGRAIFGLGYDLNNNRVFGVRQGTNVIGPVSFTNGILVLSAARDSDTFQSLDPADLYWAGWFGPNWELWHEQGGAGGFTNSPNLGGSQYWTPDDPQDPFTGKHGEWAYSEVGLSGLALKDGSWIGWAVAGGGLDFSNPQDPGTVAWGEHKQAPALPVAAPGPVSPFATSVVAAHGPFGNAPYNDPNSLLGMPATRFFDPWGEFSGGTRQRRVKLVEPAFNLDPTETHKLITTLDAGSSVLLQFDQPVTDHPAHPYGVDLLVFGNAFYIAGGFANDSSDMNTLEVTGGTFDEPLLVSVSPGFTGLPGEVADDPATWRWHTYASGPFGDSPFPTQGFVWDREHSHWTAQPMDFTRPVNPVLNARISAGGLSAADAIDLYDGSGGGTGFDLRESGFSAIRYVKIEGVEPDRYGGEIDALSVVRPAVLGESLTIAPENLVNGTAKLFFQDPADANTAALSAAFELITEVARVNAARWNDSTNLALLTGTVLDSVLFQVEPVLGSNQIAFTADMKLALAGRYAGDGSDLDVHSWDGTNWNRLAFAFDATTPAVVIAGVTNTITFTVTQTAPPSLSIHSIPAGYEMRFTPLVGWKHVLERATDFVTWTPLGDVTPATPEEASITDTAPPTGVAFYRLRLERP
jgi:hypothetical protein